MRALRLALGLVAALVAGPDAGRAASYAWGMPPAGYPPYVMPPGAERPGIYPEIMAAIGEVTGHAFPRRRLPPQRGRALFRQGELPLEVFVSPDWYDGNPPDFARFSKTVLSFRDILVFPEGEAFAYDGRPSELAGMAVATVEGYRYPGDDRFRRQDVRNEKELLEFVALGRAPVGIVNADVARWYTRRHDFAVTFGPVYDKAKLAIHVHDSVADGLLGQLNAAITQLKAEGRIQAIVERYRAG